MRSVPRIDRTATGVPMLMSPLCGCEPEVSLRTPLAILIRLSRLVVSGSYMNRSSTTLEWLPMVRSVESTNLRAVLPSVV